MRTLALLCVAVLPLTGCIYTAHVAELDYSPDTYEPMPWDTAIKIEGNWWWYIGSDAEYDWLAFRPTLGAIHSWYRVPRGELSLKSRFAPTIDITRWVAVEDRIWRPYERYRSSSPEPPFCAGGARRGGEVRGNRTRDGREGVAE